MKWALDPVTFEEKIGKSQVEDLHTTRWELSLEVLGNIVPTDNPKSDMHMQERSSPENSTPSSEQFLDSPVDFHLRKFKGVLCSHKNLRQDQERIAYEVESYYKVLEANASIVKHFGVTLSSSRIEARVCGLFSAPSSYVVETGHERQPAAELSWPDLVRKGIMTAEFHRTPVGDYIYRFRDFVVQMPEADHNLICSGFIFWRPLL